jgi:Uncharacterized conserved protein
MANSKTRLIGVDTKHALASAGVIRIARHFKDTSEGFADGVDYPDYLSLVNHKLELDKKDGEKQLEKEEERLNTLVRQMKDKGLSLLIAFQGRDAAGKSGACKRIVEGLGSDYRLLRVVPFGPPTEEERAQPPLLRFFEDNRMPEYGNVRIFDRSWLEEVLVVPVMNLRGKDTKDYVHHAYPNIRTMEWLLRRSGVVVVKLWLDITYEEQGKRFKERAEDKPWKTSPHDGVAREHWDDYTKYCNRMLYWLGSDFAPFYIIPATDKRYSRVHVIKAINQEVAAALKNPKFIR